MTKIRKSSIETCHMFSPSIVKSKKYFDIKIYAISPHNPSFYFVYTLKSMKLHNITKVKGVLKQPHWQSNCQNNMTFVNLSNKECFYVNSTSSPFSINWKRILRENTRWSWWHHITCFDLFSLWLFGVKI